MDGEFLRLLFLQAHRKITAHFIATGLPSQQNLRRLRARASAQGNDAGEAGEAGEAEGELRVRTEQLSTCQVDAGARLLCTSDGVCVIVYV